MDEKLSRNKLKKLEIELDKRLKEYVTLAKSSLTFYNEMRIASIDELLLETDSNNNPLITPHEADILRSLNECSSAYESRLQTYKRAQLKYRKQFRENPKCTLNELVDEQNRARNIKSNVDNLHDDIIEFYFRRFMTANKIVSSHIKSLSKNDLVDFLNCIEKEPHFGLGDFDNYNNMLSDTISETLAKGDCTFNQMLDRMEYGLKEFVRTTPMMDRALQTRIPHKIFFNEKDAPHDLALESMQRTMVMAMVTYYSMEAMKLDQLMKYGDITPFFYNLDSLEAYYPKKELELGNLESLLTPDYGLDAKYNQQYKVIKLKKGSKSERSKIKSKIMVQDDKITLKYIAFGVYGKKIDVVLEYPNSDSCNLLHLDYSEQKRLMRCDGKQFKTYTNHRELQLGGKSYVVHEKDYSKLLGDKDDALNSIMITDDDGTTRLNLAAIGGEALLETDKYIRANYTKILEAAKNSK